MAQDMEWGPSIWGQRFTGSGSWTLRLRGDLVELTVGWDRHTARIAGANPLRIHQGVFWTDLTLFPNTLDPVTVDGIPNRHGQAIADAIQAVVAEQKREAARRAEEERKLSRRLRFDAAYALIHDWHERVHNSFANAYTHKRWITQEQVRALVGARPAVLPSPKELADLISDADIRTALGGQLEEAERALRTWRVDLFAMAGEVNERHAQRELVECQELFQRVETRPLTEEQSRAVICFDNRVQVVASAGSGKTSTMVAKAAYAIQRLGVAPERIVMLAFNNTAARELEERAKKSFASVGINAAITAKTFHSLGLEITGHATGKKAYVPSWVGNESEKRLKMSDIVDRLKSTSAKFRTEWDMFRLVFGHSIPAFGGEQPKPDWDDKGNTGLRTLRGELVKSVDECTIANWLFYNGVDYRYERDYEFDTRTATHGQYHPDFYYPSIGLYHEHFALDKNGQPPPDFRRYMDSVHWKRDEHRRRGTDFIETTSHQLWTGKLFDQLKRALVDRGIKLDPNPDRPASDRGRVPLQHEDLIDLMSSFITHAKSNDLDEGALDSRLRKMPQDAFQIRNRIFLRLAKKVRAEWDAELATANGIDFEDMLNQAATHLEQGTLPSPYDLVLADEFQDASWARARLCLALVREPGRFLFAVGDDWQSINRFAGADVSVMTGFEQWCGQGVVLRLQQTFRCPQALCDASSHFVSKNPAQISKNVFSETPAVGAVLHAFQVPGKDQIQDAVLGFLKGLSEQVRTGTTPRGRGGKVSVFVLGRYNDDQRRYVPSNWAQACGDVLSVQLMTMHASKGSEADYVILPSMVWGGFPSLRQDDPVLALAMPGSDAYPLAEERRLFYVALTRARRAAVMFTVRGHQSPFLTELVEDKLVVVTDTTGNPLKELLCPRCKRGVIERKTGRYGVFYGCSAFPRCRYKP
ncbi:DNA helicase-4 [Lysobacter enzymogenes]|uniref:UvrD-helicase domain-containing protein n=1 Tax=Lysobacter enzymogenes TaxID=69 RepID=UPI00339B1AA2